MQNNEFSINIEDDETRELLSEHPPKTNVSLVIFTKTSLYGLRSIVVAMHYLGNGILMTSLGDAEAAASSITSTVQTLSIGASSGFLLATGNLLGESIAAHNKKLTSAIVRSAFIVTIALGTAVTILYVNSENLFNIMLAKPTAHAAGQFFKGFALATIPDLLLSTSGQIIFQIDKNPYLPLAASVLYRGSSLLCAYFLSSKLKYGALGIGLGAGIAGWTTVFILSGWFLRKKYRTLPLWTWQELNFKTCFNNIKRPGWKLSLQRITEWANLAILIQIIGAWNNNNLIAIQPSVLLLTLCNLLSQGFAAASMMIASNDCKSLSLAISRYITLSDATYLKHLFAYYTRIRKNFTITSISALLFNAALATGLYFSRHFIIDHYIPKDANNEIKTMAEQLFWVNMLSLIPDSLRITSGGLLRGWGDLLFPTLMSLMIMSIVGIPLSIGISHFSANPVLTLFIVRNILLLLSALANYYKTATHFCSEKLACLIFSLLEVFLEPQAIIEENQQPIAPNSLIITAYELRPDATHQNAYSFSTLVQQLFGTNFKQSVLKHVSQNQSLYTNFLTNEIQSILGQTNLSFDDAQKMMLLISRSFKTTIAFFNLRTSEQMTIIRQKNSSATLCIGYSEENHLFYIFDSQNHKLSQNIEHSKLDRLSDAGNMRFSQMVQIFKKSLPQPHSPSYDRRAVYNYS